MASLTLENISRRPCTLICNSGKAFHFPPHHAHEFPENEINGNAMFAKLQNLRVLVLLENINPDKKSTKKASAKKVEKNQP